MNNTLTQDPPFFIACHWKSFPSDGNGDMVLNTLTGQVRYIHNFREDEQRGLRFMMRQK